MGTIRELRAVKHSQQGDEGLTAAEQALMPLLDRVIEEYEDGGYERDHALVDKLFEVLNCATYPDDTYTMHIARTASVRFEYHLLQVVRYEHERARRQSAKQMTKKVRRK
jgi:hypothetical protein